METVATPRHQMDPDSLPSSDCDEFSVEQTGNVEPNPSSVKHQASNYNRKQTGETRSGGSQWKTRTTQPDEESTIDNEMNRPDELRAQHLDPPRGNQTHTNAPGKVMQYSRRTVPGRYLLRQRLKTARRLLKLGSSFK